MSIIDLYSTFLESLPADNRRILHSYKDLNSLIDFSTNDYLALSCSTLVQGWLEEAFSRRGFGSTGSRLLSGNSDIFELFESKIAASKGTESALIFNSGYNANISVISALLHPDILRAKALVFFDRLNHSSLYQGAILAGAKVIPYAHLDLRDLGHKLHRFRNYECPKFVVSETLFGMSGGSLAVESFLKLCNAYSAFPYLDDSHATGIAGRNNYGLGFGAALVVMGTFSKALGGFGAYVAIPRIIKDYLVNRCPGFIYTTSLPPAFIEVLSKIWDLVPELEKDVEYMMERAKNLAIHLRQSGVAIGPCDANIIIIKMKSDDAVLSVKAQLLDQGILVSAIRPPTVPRGHPRIRIAISTKHGDSDIEQLRSALDQIFCV